MIREGHVSANLGDLLPDIRGVVRSVARDEAVVDDIVQECCLRILQKERRWNPDKGLLRAWVLTVTRNLTLNYLGRCWKQRTRQTSSEGMTLPERRREDPIDSQDLEWILDRFRDVSPAQKEVLILRYYHDHNTVEIARILGISRPAVLERLDRAIATLRRRSRAEGVLSLFIPWKWDLKSWLEAWIMGINHKAAVTSIACLLVGAAGIRMAMNSSHAEQERTAERLTVENRTLKTQLAWLQNERLPSLESELAVLRRAPGGKGDVPSKEAASAAPAAQEASSNVAMRANIRTAADVAQLLRLEPARQKYFEESYGRLLPKLLDAEKRHARISREGREVVIHLPPFPDEGRALREEWSTVINGALTSPEKEQYQKLRLDQVLFPREIGLWDRTMVYEPQENTVWPKALENGNRYWPMFYERWTKPGEKDIDPATRWPWSGADAYRWYRHLLDPSDVNVAEEGR